MAERRNLTPEQWATWLRRNAHHYAPALTENDMIEIAETLEQNSAQLRRLLAEKISQR